jgi:hypothetical protein
VRPKKQGEGDLGSKAEKQGAADSGGEVKRWRLKNSGLK